ncbi:MAG TPA: phage major capsid protein [Methylomicrobium sp.]|nr:phage major capsid protein [Methylomicrobium sp.]
MAVYNKVQSRDATLVPDDISYSIIQDSARSSAALALGRRVPMSTKKSRVSVIDTFPDAYWVDGDTGLKQTTNMAWDHIWMEAEPIATLVVIPDEYIDDAAVPLWAEIRPRVAEAIGKALDNAIFWGVQKPTTWTAPYLYEGIVTAGNVKTETTDLGADIAGLAEEMAISGTNVTGFASRPGFRWKLSQLRVANAPVYASSLDSNTLTDMVPERLYGMPLRPVENGTWQSTKATLIMGDWSKLYVGVRKDITYSIHTDAVITDAAGAVVFNAMQQDSKIMRVVARYGYTIVDPSTSLEERPFPFAALRPSGAPAS